MLTLKCILFSMQFRIFNGENLGLLAMVSLEAEYMQIATLEML